MARPFNTILETRTDANHGVPRVQYSNDEQGLDNRNGSLKVPAVKVRSDVIEHEQGLGGANVRPEN